jgi:hypothetical protein
MIVISFGALLLGAWWYEVSKDFKEPPEDPSQRYLDMFNHDPKADEKYELAHKARIEANRKWETEQFGAPCKLDEDGRMIKIDGGILLEDGTVFIDENYKV